MIRVGLVGARGYVGAEMLGLLAQHASIEVALATSAEAAGKRVAEHVPAFAAKDPSLTFESLEPEAAGARALDVVVLGLPNGKSAPWIRAFSERSPRTLIVDLSADHRFDEDWVYGQPEQNRARIRDARRIANPGCYATASELAILPIKELVDGFATVFGVSGYSGAGATPSPKNDPAVLRDNLLPYALVDHVHEREIRRALGVDVDFIPHVAPFFRGITVTVSLRLKPGRSARALRDLYEARYAEERLVKVTEEIPLVRDIAGSHEVRIGGFTATGDGRHAVVVATIDNLLGGAATQALRNINLASGLPELEGIH
ncbi:MAG: N-acetyl-gamma-glutamyl-phosphate reductase [Polyangiaceae bacterium]